MKNKLEFRVVEISEKENLSGKSVGVVKLKAASSYGRSQILLQMDPDEVNSYDVGESYTLNLSMIATAQAAE